MLLLRLDVDVNAATPRCDILVTLARNMIPIVVAMDNEATDFIVLYRFFFVTQFVSKKSMLSR